MPGPTFWIFLTSVVTLLTLVRIGYYLWERFMLTSEQRWQRKYDRRMKNFFKGI